MKTQITATQSHRALAGMLAWISSVLDQSPSSGRHLTPSGAGRRSSRPWALPVLQALACGALALAVPGLAWAQATVPLLPLAAYRAMTAAGPDQGTIKYHLPGRPSLAKARAAAAASIIHADPSQLDYGQIQPGEASLNSVSADVQVNDPSLDYTAFYQNIGDPFAFEFATESESTLAADGNTIIVSYNSSAGVNLVAYRNKLYLVQLLLSGYSVSHDGGSTWHEGVIPGPNTPIMLGDGVVGKDRAGNFYYATLGISFDPTSGLPPSFAVLVAKSTDHGDTFSNARVVAADNGADKEWMAVGPDPGDPSRDNIYVTWTSFGPNNSTLWFSRSTDGGMTWSKPAEIFGYSDDGVLSSYIQFSNPVVDPTTGRLYVPFLHYSDGNADDLRVLVSNDAGETFNPVAFNVPGAPDANAYPFVEPGTLADCGGGGIQLVVKEGSNVANAPSIKGGAFPWLPLFVHCTRLVSQPATAARNGALMIALNTSTSPYFGDPQSGARIIALYSPDGGVTWQPPVTVADATAAEPRHFHPAVALSPDGSTLYVGYYAQQANEQVRTELATLSVSGGGLAVLSRQPLSSVAFHLEPSNIPDPIRSNNTTINFDQNIVPGYDLGEYMGVATDSGGNPIAAWGDNRNLWVSPHNALYPGLHPQADVFFTRPLEP